MPRKHPAYAVPTFALSVASIVASPAPAGCSSHSAQPATQTVSVGLGNTCGEVQNVPSEVEAICALDAGYPDSQIAGGSSCAVIDDSYPDGSLGLRVGLCAPFAAGCSGLACPSGYDCILVTEPERSVAICLRPCTTSADCAGPLQVCVAGHCQTHACASAVSCGPGASCSDSLCVSGDASTR
jgi:hypothetical protein